jgi:hypothetical protein
MATKLGLNAKLYYNTGSYGTPTWTLCDFMKDVSLELSSAEADATTRANGGWKATLATLQDASLTFTAPHDVSITAYAAFVDAWYDRTPLELLILDQAVATAGATGLRASFIITGMTEGQPIEDIQANDFTLKLTNTYDGSGDITPPVQFTTGA